MKNKLFFLPAALLAITFTLATYGQGLISSRELPTVTSSPFDTLYQADIKLAEKLNPYKKYAVSRLHNQVKKAAADLKTKEPAEKTQIIDIDASPGSRVVLYPDRRLRRVSLPVNEVNDEIRNLIAQMKNIVRKMNGLGLSAPQVGVNLRIIVLYINGDFIELINPQIITAKGSEFYKEGCLSLPWVSGEVERYAEIAVKGIGSDGRLVEYSTNGVEACIAQHEIDHLDGILFIDRADSLEKVAQ